MDNKTVQACLHRYGHLTQYICRKRRYFVFKIQKVLAPVWWRLAVWRCFLVATMPVLLSLCSRVMCFSILWIAQKLAQSNCHFPILLTEEWKCWVPSVTHWCVLGTPALCRSQSLLLPLLGLIPWCFTLMDLACPSPWKEPLSESF